MEGDTGLPNSSFALGTFQRDQVQVSWDYILVVKNSKNVVCHLFRHAARVTILNKT